MGKDKKANQAEKKARVAERANKKAAQKEKKGKTKGRYDESDAEDVDLDAVLEEYARQASLAFYSSIHNPSLGFTNRYLVASPIPQSH
jgi:hypothetical protein